MMEVERMDDYISRESVLDLTARKNSIWDKITDSSGRGLTEIVNSVPAANVVEVVRCRDCAHFMCFGSVMECGLYAWGSNGLENPEQNDYCSKGVRKEPI